MVMVPSLPQSTPPNSVIQTGLLNAVWYQSTAPRKLLAPLPRTSPYQWKATASTRRPSWLALVMNDCEPGATFGGVADGGADDALAGRDDAGPHRDRLVDGKVRLIGSLWLVEAQHSRDGRTRRDLSRLRVIRIIPEHRHELGTIAVVVAREPPVVVPVRVDRVEACRFIASETTFGRGRARKR